MIVVGPLPNFPNGSLMGVIRSPHLLNVQVAMLLTRGVHDPTCQAEYSLKGLRPTAHDLAVKIWRDFSITTFEEFNPREVWGGIFWYGGRTRNCLVGGFNPPEKSFPQIGVNM